MLSSALIGSGREASFIDQEQRTGNSTLLYSSFCYWTKEAMLGDLADPHRKLLSVKVLHSDLRNSFCCKQQTKCVQNKLQSKSIKQLNTDTSNIFEQNDKTLYQNGQPIFVLISSDLQFTTAG